jgi:phosphatidylserine synthase
MSVHCLDKDVPKLEWCQALYNRYLSGPLVRIFAALGITPNQVTIINFLFILTIGIWAFATRHYYVGLAVCLINGVLDYVDGDLARHTNQYSRTGEWLDSGGDVIIQNGIMAAIAYGLLTLRPAVPLLSATIMLYFMGNSSMNLISFHYNNTFGFNSHAGSKLFRKYMDTKPSLLNRFLKNLVDPTASHLGMVFWTVRYWLVAGVFSKNMHFAFYTITSILIFRAFVMYVIYAMHLAEYKKLWILQALAIVDDEREEFYKIRGNK